MATPSAVPMRCIVWVKDDHSPACQKCSEAFSFFNRRHHCRGCGALACGNCCPKRAAKEAGATGPAGMSERMCNTCDANGTLPAPFHAWE